MRGPTAVIRRPGLKDARYEAKIRSDISLRIFLYPVRDARFAGALKDVIRSHNK